MRFNKADGFLMFVALCGLLLVVGGLHSVHRQKADLAWWQERRALVERLGLSDLALFTDARYMRHLTLADLNTAFQDYPMSFEHFPSGSVLSMPPHLRPQGSR